MNQENITRPRLIIDGQNARAEILSGITQARQTIRIRAYMWRDDTTGRQILSALIGKIAENPRIRIVIEKDAFGSRVYDFQRLISLGRLRGDIFS
jgi:phosphatidylserine/phosphatidylglycerophosphate/cardiolipin synthase-like enzyme